MTKVLWTRGLTVVAGAALVAATVAPSTGAWAKATPVALPPVVTSPTWVQQLGGPGADGATQIAVDRAGNTYVLGASAGHLAQAPDDETGALFIAKYAPDGTAQWVRQFGAANSAVGCGIVADAVGNVTVVGFSKDSVDGTPWLAKYDTNGNFVSQTSLAMQGGNCLGDAALDDAGDLYFISSVAVTPGPGTDAQPYAALLVRVDPNDTVAWTSELSGTNTVIGRAVTVDQRGNVYLVGASDGVVAGAHDRLVAGGFEYGFVARYDASGVRHWVHEFGAAAIENVTYANGVAVDAAGNVAVAGWSSDNLVGSPDIFFTQDTAFIVDFTAAGKQRFIHELGAKTGPLPGTYGKQGLAIAATGADVVLVGETINVPPGQHGQPEDQDVFVAEFDLTGAMVGYNEIGSSGPDVALAVAVDRFANTTVVGSTWGTLPGSRTSHSGDYDGFVMHYQAASTESVANAKARARAGVIDFTVTLNQAAASSVAVDFATHNDSAIAGTDYQATSGALVFPAGATTATIPVTVNPAGAPGKRKFTIALTNPAGVVLAQATAVGTITFKG
jgi:hypothetical protein